MYEEITGQARQAVTELLERARLEPGDIFVVGCSSSEVGGHRIGSDSSPEVAQAILDGIYPILKEKGIYLAAQCCEHLNRAIVLEKEAARTYGLAPVNVVPQPKAGGSFAAAAYKAFSHPVMVEHVKAAAGIDIGGTLIGMHLREVAVPTRLSIKQIGEANIICARTRPKFIGGQRAHYDESQM
ncbi:TIGR01440 family protein [Ruminococcaceae bacterium AM28-23LB]|nr:TIGR01440 family protein [Ruminococcaceae bacterium AM28-23LB]